MGQFLQSDQLASWALGQSSRSNLLDSLPVGVHCCDRDGTVRLFNRRAAELWGRCPELGATGQRFCGSYRLFRTDGRPLAHHETPMAEVLRTGAPAHDHRVVIERPDGSRVFALVNADPLFDTEGRLVGAVSCLQDITDLKRAQDELECAKDDFRDVFENSIVGLHIIAPDGTILRANGAQLKLLGYSAEEFIGRNIADFHVDRAVIDDLLARLARAEKVERCPARLRAKNGSSRRVLIRANAQFRHGKLVHSRCFASGVAEANHADERVSESDQRLQDLLRALPVAVYTTDAEGRITFFNQATVDMAGRRPALGTDRLCVSWRVYWPDGTPLPLEQSPIAIALREGRAVRGMQAILERPDGTRVPYLPYPTPLRDAAGNVTGAVNVLADITDKLNADLSAARLAAIVASSADAILSKTLDGRITSWNAGAERILGFKAEEIIGEHITRLIPAELHAEEDAILARLRRGERMEHYDTVRMSKDGRRIDVSLTVSPVYDGSGRITGASSVARDVSDRKRAEEQQRLLVSELNHRVKNMLGIVQSLAQQSLRRAKSPADFAEAFTGRLQALARAHGLLSDATWAGADLATLVRDQLLLGSTDDPRVSCSGPSIRLDPQAVLNMAMIVHELSTNARKHGALSTPGGRLSVSWLIDASPGRFLQLRWREKGTGMLPPARAGFGTTLIGHVVKPDGDAQMTCEADGIAWDIRLPLPAAAAQPSGAVGQPRSLAHSDIRPGRGADTLRGKRILIVEDEPLIALELADSVAEAGMQVIKIARTPAEALGAVAGMDCDVALLDANLSGEQPDTVAAALARRNVPFAFVTGYGREALPQQFQDRSIVQKPFTAAQVIRAIGDLLGVDRRYEVTQVRSGDG